MIPPNRRPIVIADSHLSAGGAMAHVRADEPEAPPPCPVGHGLELTPVAEPDRADRPASG